MYTYVDLLDSRLNRHIVWGIRQRRTCRSKVGPGAAPPCMLARTLYKILKNAMGKMCLGPHRRIRIAVIVEFGEAGPGCGKAGPSRNKAMQFHKTY